MEKRQQPTDIDVLRCDIRRTFPGASVGQVLGFGSSAHIVAIETLGASWVAKVGRTPECHNALVHEELVLRTMMSPAIPVVISGVRRLADQRPMLLMTRCDGHALSTIRIGARAGTLLISNLLKVLQGVHERGWVHRDVKPGNVLFETHGGRVSLVDFGEAWRIGEPRPNEQSVGGTPEYMSPEQLCGVAAEPSADVYAVGALLYELLSGHRAFSRHTTTRDLYLDKSAEDFRLVSSHEGVPPSTMDELTSRMLAADPAARPSLDDCLPVLLCFQADGIDWATPIERRNDVTTRRSGEV